METTWELFEQVGIHPDDLMGSDTGVYVGISANSTSIGTGGSIDIDAYTVLGTAHSAVVGRLSCGWV